MEKIQRIVETENHLYLVEYTTGWLNSDDKLPHDVVLLAVDGKYFKDAEEEVDFILGMEQEEHTALIAGIREYEQAEQQRP